MCEKLLDVPSQWRIQRGGGDEGDASPTGTSVAYFTQSLRMSYCVSVTAE